MVDLNNAQNVNLNIQMVPDRWENINRDKFLFCFEPVTLAKESCCGCSLKTGVQMIALIFIAAALSNFFSALRTDSIFNLILSGFAFVLYFIAGVCVIYSTMSFSFIMAHTGYVIYAIVFIINAADNLIVLLLIFLGVYAPFGGSDSFKIGLVFLAAIACIIGIHLYLVWIVFSYAIHLKHNRLQLVLGNIFVKHDEVMASNAQYTASTTNPVNATQGVTNPQA
jgi:hypothetical protein